MVVFSEHSDLLDEKNEMTTDQFYPNLLNCKEVGWLEIARLLELMFDMIRAFAERSNGPLGNGLDKAYEEALRIMKLDKENHFSSINHSVPITLMVKFFRFIAILEQLLNRLAKRFSKKEHVLPLIKVNYRNMSISEINTNQLIQDYAFAHIQKCSEEPINLSLSPYETLYYLDGKFDTINTEKYTWEIFLQDLYDALIQLDVYMDSIIFYMEVIKEPITDKEKIATRIVSSILSITFALKTLSGKWQLIQKYCNELRDLKLIPMDGDKISTILFKKLCPDISYYHYLLQELGTDAFMKPIAHPII